MAFRLDARIYVAAACALLLASFDASAKKPEIISPGLRFEANLGQADPRVRFLSLGEGYTLSLSAGHSELILRNSQNGHAVVRMNLIGSNPKPDIRGTDKLTGISNYFLGNDPENWHTDVPNYAKVEYRHVYPGVDLVYYGKEGDLEYDFIVAAGADPQIIQFSIEGIEQSAIDDEGNLVLDIPSGRIRLQRPVTYQEIDGVKHAIDSEYVLTAAHTVGFRLGNYDQTRPLVIDPVLTYSSYFGGTGGSMGRSIALDSANNMYIVGNAGDRLPMPNPPPATPSQQSTYISNSSPAFVAKFTSNGTLVYSTYLGGSSYEEGRGIAVDPLDPSGAAYVTGETYSRDFPTRNPLPGKASPRVDQTQEAFVSKLDSNGRLVYSTYLGSSAGDDGGKGITIDSSGRVYVTGLTGSDNFPVTANALQLARQGSFDAFVTVLEYQSASGILSIRYSTYLGGDSDDLGLAIARDVVTGYVYVTGRTFSSNFPALNALFAPAGHYDAFVTVLNPNSVNSATALLFSTYLGGSGPDEGDGIRLDALGNIFVTGQTFSIDFPTTPGAFKTSASAALPDLFVTKINAGGTALVYSTYLGGNGRDEVFGIALAVDSSGSAYVGGHTTSMDFPLIDAYQTMNDSQQGTGFVSKLDPTGSFLQFSTFLGGAQYDSVNGVAVDATGKIYLTGDTTSTDFPVTTNPAGRPYPTGAQTSAFISVITPSPVTPVLTSLSFNPNSVTVGGTTTGTVTIAAAAAGNTTVTLNSSDPSRLTVPATVTIPAGQTSASFTATAGLTPGTVTVSATLGAVTRTADVTVTPAPPRLVSLKLDPCVVTGGVENSTGTVTLSSKAPEGGVLVTLSSSSPYASVPQTVLIPKDQTYATFTVTTTEPPNTTQAVITASVPGSSVSDTLTINPVVRTISSFSFSPGTVAVGQASTGTITLGGPPVVRATQVSLTGMPGGSPVSVTVGTGQTSVSFAANTSTAGTYTVTAKLGASTKQATLTVTAPPASYVAFEKFTADVDINLRHGDKNDMFRVDGMFKLGRGSNGINPLRETVVLRVASYTVTVPAGSFKAVGCGDHHDDDDWERCNNSDHHDGDDDDDHDDHDGDHNGGYHSTAYGNDHDDHDDDDDDDCVAKYSFRGVINGVDLTIQIWVKRDGTYRYVAAGVGKEFTGVTRPVPVDLTIGQDKGSTTDPKAKIH